MKPFKVLIKVSGNITHEAEFDSVELRDEWLYKHEVMGSFGQPRKVEQVLVSEEVKDEAGNVVTPAQYDEVVTEGYVVELVDQSAEIEKLKAKEESRKAARLALKDLDLSKVTTVAGLKAVVKNLIDSREDIP